MKLKATKNRLYKLTSKYFPLPAIEQTVFTKGDGDYLLSWGRYDSYDRGRAFLSAICGQPSLYIDFELECIKDVKFTLEELQELHLIETCKTA